jgi:hypothetical protein
MLSQENPLRGAPHIHGELLKLGINVGETSVGKYMVRRRTPPSQTWRTFLDNHLKTLVSVDFFVLPTIRFQLLYVFLVLAHERRRIVHFAVTAHPTAEWTAQQMREAFPWDNTAVPAAGSRSDLRPGLREASQGDGHQAGAVGATLTVATCLRGTCDRHYSSRVPGSLDRVHRAKPVPTPPDICGLLSLDPPVLGIAERHPRTPADPAASVWPDRLDTSAGRPASSIRAVRRLSNPTTDVYPSKCRALVVDRIKSDCTLDNA